MGLPIRAVLLAVAGCACVGAAVAVAVGACVVVPPPELQQRPPHRPTILHASVDPPAIPFLMDWPPTKAFDVPVQFDDPANDGFVWVVFVDGNRIPGGQLRPRLPDPSALDGGVMVIHVMVDPVLQQIDLTLCHVIKVRVAHDFDVSGTGEVLYDTPDSVGGDIIWWNYVGPGGPSTCREVDAGVLAAADASSDGLPIPPLDGGGEL